ncbi:sulfatase [Salinigranum marinum]|uniref:sulfatase n=1 Tax=Salinigranum marinum TaxID=1515595 RepID=UPI002989F65F|nr:sulfatase [Salinigranum marinum]
MTRSQRPNVIWLTIESTRTDHTTFGGADTDTTPNLARIADADRGRAVPGCVAHGVWTLPSSASILTGTYPTHHGAGITGEAIPDKLPTVAERLREVGYHTRCLSPNSHLSSATGLDRGFDEFAWVATSTLRETMGLRTLFRYLRNLRAHGGGLSLEPRRHGTDFMMTDRLTRWLRSAGASREPYFVYLHYGGPHRPYLPPAPYYDRLATDETLPRSAAYDLAADHHDNLFEHIADGCPFSSTEWATLSALYDAEIAHVDDLIGELFDTVRSLDGRDTVLVVTSDHGELFGEGGLLAHQIVVHDAVVDVPLVVHGFDELADYDGDAVQHADVMRTLLEAAGAPTEGMQGLDLRTESRDRAIVQRGGERARQNLEQIAQFDPAFDTTRYHDGTLHAVRTPTFKYLRSDDRTELFRLPDETRDVSDAYPDVISHLDGGLSEWLETTGRPLTDERVDGEFSGAMRQQLRDLGYLVE